MSRFEGTLASRPFVTIAIEAASEQTFEEPRIARIEGVALVDTGSEISGITRLAADRLALSTNATVSIATALGDNDVASYLIRLEIEFSHPKEVKLVSQNLKVFEDQSDWPAQMSGFEVVALLGMDVLDKYVLVVDGPGDTFLLRDEEG